MNLKSTINMHWCLGLLGLGAGLVGRVAAADVAISDAEYEGRPHYKIITPEATWFYDRAGGGFSRLIDRDGHDWIAYHAPTGKPSPAGTAADFRGLPNLVYGKDNPEAGTGHPGFDLCETELAAPDTLRTRSKTGTWAWSWRFTVQGAIFTMERADAAHRWWFLYEGPIAGRFAPSAQYWGTNAGGPRRETPEHKRNESIPGKWRWVYFGDRDVPRVLFLAQMGPPDELDATFGYMGNTKDGVDSPDGMVVFGFGRHGKPLLSGAGQRFIAGFVEQAVATPAGHDRLAAAVAHRVREVDQ